MDAIEVGSGTATQPVSGVEYPTEAGVEAGRAEDEPPSSSPRHPFWRDVPAALWNDWRWQSQNAVRTVRQLSLLLPLESESLEALSRLEDRYKLAIPPYYFSLIQVDDPQDPIRLQSVVSPLEEALEHDDGLADPLEEELDSPVPGLTHRYPDRALLVTTHVCSMYCRFCTRKRVTMVHGGWDGISRNDERMLEYIRSHSEIRDVVVSGGDPLTLPLAKLRFFVQGLAAIPHVDVIRIGTRVPVTLPQRLGDPSLIHLLASAGKVWIQTHFNHPRELTPEAGAACQALFRAGLPVNNQTVLLKGVNDDLETLRLLCRGLLRLKIRPYYLFHCDPVMGAGHFRTSIWKGIELMEGLRGHLSGLGIPTYVVDSPHGGGKIPLLPSYLVSASERAVVLRNFEGMLVRYEPEERPRAEEKARAVAKERVVGQVPPVARTLGVSGLLSGDGTALVPSDHARMARRRARAAQEALSPMGLEPSSELLPPLDV